MKKIDSSKIKVIIIIIIMATLCTAGFSRFNGGSVSNENTVKNDDKGLNVG